MNVVKGFIVVVLALSLSACGSSTRYIKAPSALPPDLGITASDDSYISLSVNHVILPDGPGAWVKKGVWDEYVLTIRNISDKPLAVEKIRIIDPRGKYLEGGDNPERLEKLSEAMMAEYKDIGISVAIGVAPAVAMGAAATAGAFGTAVGAAALAPVALVAAPVYYFSKSSARQRDKEDIEAEFNRRRLGNFTIAGNSTIEGSVFYPIVPNPRALVVDYRIGNEFKTLEVSLEKLKGIHIAPPEDEKGIDQKTAKSEDIEAMEDQF